MRNPAWQPARRDHPVLRQLREHYVPDAAAGHPETGGQVLRVPVIAACANYMQDANYLIEALNRQLNLRQGNSAEPLHWWLSALQADDLRAAPELPFVLVIAQADLPALREAYGQIKQVHRRHATGFGVLIHGARDSHAARRYYRRLAMAAMGFLDLDVLDFGIMPVRDHAFGAALARLAQGIREGALGHGKEVAFTEEHS